MMSLRIIGSSFLATGLLLVSANAGAWTTNINCEGGSVGAKVAEGGANQFSSTFAKTVYSNEQASSGSQSCKMGVTAGSDGWGEFGATYEFPSHVARGGEVWVRVNMFVPSGFDQTTNTGVLKFMRVHTATSGGANEGYHDLLISNPGATFWDAGVGNWVSSYIYNFEGFPKLLGVGVRPTDDLKAGKWESYEMYVKFDSTAANAGGQGVMRIWKNNKMLYERRDQATLVGTGSYADAFYLFTYWNGNAPATQSLYIDDVVVTSDTPPNRDASGNPFIGGNLVASRAPSPPTSVSTK
jgi:hypothetical protein